MQPCNNDATLQRNNHATFDGQNCARHLQNFDGQIVLGTYNHATIMQPCNETITQPCNATIMQPCIYKIMMGKIVLGTYKIMMGKIVLGTYKIMMGKIVLGT
jgi:hypothetical protein